LDDFKELIPNDINKNKNNKDNVVQTDYGKLVDTIFTIGLSLSILITGYRSSIANIFIVIFVLIIIRFAYLLFNNATGWDTKTILGSNYSYFKQLYNEYHIKFIHNEINTLISIIVISFFIYITYKNRKRF
jgi:hypothetical protein